MGVVQLLGEGQGGPLEAEFVQSPGGSEACAVQVSPRNFQAQRDPLVLR